MEWNKDQVLVLIDLFRERRFLWDSSDSQHKSKSHRHDNLKEIAESFGVDKNEIERKWKNLTSHFWRERKKEVEAKKTWSDEPYVSKWFAYQALDFLGEKNKPRNTQENPQIKEEEVVPQDSQEEGIYYDDSEVVHPQTSEDEQASMPPSEFAGTKRTINSPKALRRKSSRRRIIDSPGSSIVVDEALNIMRSLRSKISVDEYSLFGEQIAIKLRKLSSPRTRLLVQNKINELFFEAEMGYLDQAYNEPQVNIRENSGPANHPMVPSFPQTSSMPNQTQPPFDNVTNSTSQWFSSPGHSSLPSPESSYSQAASQASDDSELSMDFK